MKVGEDILKLVKKQDRRAQKELYRLCFGDFMSITMRFCNNREDAVELVNIGFMKIFENINTIPTAKDFIPWSKRIMTNECINNYRKLKRKITTTVDFELGDYFASIDNPDKSAEIAKQLKPRIMALLETLPPSTHEVFQLYVFEGLTHQEIADFVGISEGTSKWHLNNARTMLKSAVEAEVMKLIHEEY